jgi:hypothetical protein
MFGQLSGAQSSEHDAPLGSASNLRPGLRAQLDLLLTTGGSHDIWPDPHTGRTPLGTYTRPALHEIWLSSGSVSNIGPHGYKAAGQALEAIVPGGSVEPLALGHWFDDVRASLLEFYGIDGADVMLASTQQDAEELALSLARCILKRPLAPVSTTSSFIGHSLGTDYIEPYENDGSLQAPATILETCVRKVDHLLTDGRAILMHVDERTASSHVPLAIAMLAPLRTLVVVDATDLRCSRSMIRRHLAQGFMVIISGSRFAGGPPSCAALLLPPDLVEHIVSAQGQDITLPSLASFDMPRSLRHWILSYTSVANLGLGLRWSAAIAELRRYYAVDREIRHQIIDHFDRKLRSRAAMCHFIGLHQHESSSFERSAQSRIALLLPPAMTFAEAKSIHTQLAQPYIDQQGDAICHLGDVHIIGSRLCLSAAINAAQIADMAERMTKGLSFESACAPLTRDIDSVMRKWDLLDMINSTASAA